MQRLKKRLLFRAGVLYIMGAMTFKRLYIQSRFFKRTILMDVMANLRGRLFVYQLSGKYEVD